MTRLPRSRGWLTAALLLSLSILAIHPSPSMGGDKNSPTGFSDHLLIPESPYLFTNSITLWNGYRNDHIEPGLGADNLDFYQLGLEADLHWDKINAIGSIDFGWGSQGTDSLDWLAGFGYDIDLTVTGIQLTPLAGYGASHLNRDARYNSEWAGPFLGAKLEVPLAEKWLLQASYFYHWAAFESELSTPAVVINRADAAGHTGRLDLIYQVNERLDLKLGTEIQSFTSEAGSFSRTAADWESWGVRVGVSLKF